MTYNVFGGKLNLTQPGQLSHCKRCTELLRLKTNRREMTGKTGEIRVVSGKQFIDFCPYIR